MGALWRGFWRTLWRVIVVVTAFAFASITAMMMLIFLGGREVATAFSTGQNPDPIFDIIFNVWGAMLFTAALGPALTVVPAIGAIIIGEVARIKSAIYYVLTGGLAILAIPFLHETGDGISGAGAVNAHYIILFLASGFIAGFIYWLIAGRNA